MGHEGTEVNQDNVIEKMEQLFRTIQLLLCKYEPHACIKCVIHPTQSNH